MREDLVVLINRVPRVLLLPDKDAKHNACAMLRNQVLDPLLLLQLGSQLDRLHDFCLPKSEIWYMIFAYIQIYKITKLFKRFKK